MPDPRGKFPGDLGTPDWDSLLTDLEQKKEPAEKTPIPGSAKPREEPPPLSARGAPLYKPPQPPALPSSYQPDPEEEEERTVVGVISRDLIEEASRGGGGLGQLFGKAADSSRRPEIPLDLGPARPSPVLDDGSIMTSVPALLVAEASAHDRVTPVPEEPSGVEVDLDSIKEIPDPFAPPPPPRHEQPTLQVEQDEPTRIGQILPLDLDAAAIRAEILGTKPPARVPPPPAAPPTPAVPASDPTPAAPAAPPAAPAPPRTTPSRPAAKVPPRTIPARPEPPREAIIEIAEEPAPLSVEEGPLSLGKNALPAIAPSVSLPDERDAVAFLAEVDGLQEWADRAAWMEAEARVLEDKTARARALLVVSEILAMTGEEERSQALAEEARDLAPSLFMAHRQVRSRLVRERGFEGLLPALDMEARTAGTAAGRAHAALLGAEIARHVSRDHEAAARRLEQAARLMPSDPRPHLLQVASELGKGARTSRYRWPEDPALAPLVATARYLGALRGSYDKEAAPASAAEALPRIRDALARGDRDAAAETLARVQGDDGVGRAARWLAANLAAPQAATRDRALAWASSMAGQEEAIQRRLAGWSFEAGDAARATETLSSSKAFSPAERAAARALLGTDPDSLASDLKALASTPSRPLASALASALGASPIEVGSSAQQSASALGRSLARSPDEASAAIQQAAAQTPDEPITQLLQLDSSLASRRHDRVAAALASWPMGQDAPVEQHRDRAIAAALAYALGGATPQALQELENARETDSLHEATSRIMAAIAPDRAPALLDQLAADTEDPSRRSLLLLEAAVRQGTSSDSHGPLLRLAHETAPDFPIPATLGLEAARRAGDAEAALTWLRARLEFERSPGDLLREALTIQESSPEQAAERLQEALQTCENDITLRELAEQITPGRTDPSWRAARALHAAPPASALQASRAALELELARDLPAAARLAQLASETGGSALSRLLRDRCDAAGPGATHLAEELIALAKNPPSPAAEREAYQRLADLDEHGRRDPSAALPWHQALLERFPGWLPSLRYLEHRYTSEGRDDELEGLHASIAEALQGGEAAAHAQVAARLRMRHSPWETTRDLADLAFRAAPTAIWALRQAQAHARASGNAELQRRVTDALLARTTHRGERAALLLQAATATQKAGDHAAAIAQLRAALELVPGHLTALTQLADLLEAHGDPAEAAATLATAARAHQLAVHQAPLWYRAALLWLDKTDHKDQGVEALEAAAACDINQGDTFERLRALLTERREGAKLAALLQRRLETEESPERRIELEVALGRALTEMGDRQAAKQALAAALDSSPDHVEALRAFVDLCMAEEDWESAEQALLRLGCLLPAPAEQAELYLRLGDIYRLHLPNPERAEVAYGEVLKRDPENTPVRERLVQLHTSQGNAARALEIQNELLAAAAGNPADKRQRTIELAQIHEQALQDTKKAEQILDGLRKEFPQETRVLRALAEFHLRHDHAQAANLLLDRTAADARRALSTGRFELHFFANLAMVFELRGNEEAASVANGTVAALDGKLCEVEGIGLRGARHDLDEHIAPELFSAPFRTLLQRSAELLDGAVVVDPKALRATPLPPSAQPVADRIQQLASAFGLPDLQLLTAPTVPSACLPASISPPTLILAAPLLAEQNEEVRTFLVLRALKCIQTGTAVFCRTAPIDLWPMTAAFLQTFSPSWAPQGVDANKLKDFKNRLQKNAPAAIPPDLAALAGEITSSIGNRASTLQTMTNAWGSRCALLVTGNLATALDAIAWAAGQAAGAPSTNPDRMKWIGRNAEARDLVSFSVSDPYFEARSR